MAKLVVVLKDRQEPIEFPNGHVSIAQPGVFVISDREENGNTLGIFPIPSTQGIYHPEGVDLVQPVQGIVVP